MNITRQAGVSIEKIVKTELYSELKRTKLMLIKLPF